MRTRSGPDAMSAVLTDSVSAMGCDAHSHIGPLAELELELASKNSLVETLTEQLERAAEEIDRMQRSGADRRRGSGGLPADLIDDQRQLMTDMQRIVQQWEDLQAGLALGRMEIQLTELREFVGDRLENSNFTRTMVESSDAPAVITEPAPISGSRLFRSESNTAPAPTTGLSAWEQLKSQMLELPPEPAEESADETFAAAHEPLPPAPEPIDEATADVGALQTAVYARDAYISSLLRRLRAVEEMRLPTDWSHLEPSAPDLIMSLQHMSARLEETLRMAEVELSLERAQVSRTQMQVAAQQEMIAKHLKRVGVTSIDELASAIDSAATPDRRWSRFLGSGKK